MNIIILTEKDRIDNQRFRIKDERFIHVKNILNAEKGDILEIGILNGMLGKASIQVLSENSIILELVESIANEDLIINIDLICALPRPQTLKKILNLCGTMGVNNLFLIRSEKVEKSYFHSPLLKEENYTKYLIDGLSQGKRTKLPKVYFFKRFKEFFENNFNKNLNRKALFVADQQAKYFLNNDDISSSDNITVAIGPEGGWNDFELKFMEGKGFRPIKLSNSTLRVENAVNALLSQIELLVNAHPII